MRVIERVMHMERCQRGGGGGQPIRQHAAKGAPRLGRPRPVLKLQAGAAGKGEMEGKAVHYSQNRGQLLRKQVGFSSNRLPASSSTCQPVGSSARRPVSSSSAAFCTPAGTHCFVIWVALVASPLPPPHISGLQLLALNCGAGRQGGAEQPRQTRRAGIRSKVQEVGAGQMCL